jgi:Reverse transcriptase (RNA-dependent DNA polymerase)
VGALRLDNGSLTTDPVLKANMLSSYFKSVFVSDNGSSYPSTHSHSGIQSFIKDINFHPNDVYHALKKLKSRSAGGPDAIPPIFIKNCASYLSSPLAFLYDNFFNCSYLPPVWLQAYITPLFKKGDTALVSNYRPISLTCTFCKIMEVLIKDQLLSYLCSNNLISKEQHGFISRHSTVTNLLDCIHDWTLSIRNKLPTDVVYIDFKRAFDSVVHSKLLAKLSAFGISGNLLSWISSFLTGRTQCVTIENCFSEWVDVTSGVPQGSVLGPLLFILFINDVINICDNGVCASLFADDLKLYSSIDTWSNALSLQQVLCNLEDWSKCWQLEVNISKSHVLHIGSSCSKYNNIYYYNGTALTEVDCVRDLGVLVDSSCSFDSHINSIVGKAYSRIGIIFKGFRSRDKCVLKQAYITFVRPVLEYASSVWSPYKKKHINALENVQRYFTRRVPALRDLSYLDRLASLNIETLELRRLRFDLYMYFKILNNLSPWDPNFYFSYLTHNFGTRSSNSTLTIPKSSTKIVNNEFFVRHITCWNSLPLKIKSAASFQSFKTLLSNLDLSRFLTIV